MRGSGAARTVVHYVESREVGGTELAVLTLTGELARGAAWRPIIAHHGRPELRPLMASAAALGVETVELPSLDAFTPRTVARFARALRRLRPALLHVHLPWPGSGRRAILAARLARVPAIVATAQLYMPLGSRLQRLKVRLAQADRYIAVSQAVADGLRDLGVPDRRISVVYNVAASMSGPSSTHAEASPPAHHGTLVAVGRLAEQKGYPVLLEAMAGLPDASLLVAGEGSLRTQLEALVTRLGIADRVQFLGHVEAVGDVLARGDIFVLTSINEGLPLAVVEAMAAGLPVVATRVGGTPEAVRDGDTGILVESGDVAGTRAAIRRLLDDRVLARQMGRRGREVALARFSREAMVQGVSRVYEQALAKT